MFIPLKGFATLLLITYTKKSSQLFLSPGYRNFIDSSDFVWIYLKWTFAYHIAAQGLRSVNQIKCHPFEFVQRDFRYRKRRLRTLLLIWADFPKFILEIYFRNAIHWREMTKLTIHFRNRISILNGNCIKFPRIETKTHLARFDVQGNRRRSRR